MRPVYKGLMNLELTVRVIMIIHVEQCYGSSIDQIKCSSIMNSISMHHKYTAWNNTTEQLLTLKVHKNIV